MAGKLTANQIQLGDSATATQNFVLQTNVDGSAKLARGNAGATTQDILTVDASGNVLVGGNNLNLFSNKSLTTAGYQKLPSGLIIQWGRLGVGDIGSDYYGSVAFPITFPNNLFMINATLYSYNQGAFDATVAVTAQRLTGFDFTVQEWTGGSQNIDVVYIAIGY